MGKRRKKSSSVRVEPEVALPTPDPNNDDFYEDKVDQYHTNRDKIMLSEGADIPEPGVHQDEDEVLAVAGDSDQEDEQIAVFQQRLKKFQSLGFKDDLASDIEDEQDLPDVRAWGKSADEFYGTDVHDDNLGYLVGSDDDVEADAAVLEEQEALLIQRRLTSQLDQTDLALDLFQPLQKSAAPTQSKKITKDLSMLSRKEKLRLVKKESPALMGIITELKTRLRELDERLLPVLTLIQDGVLPSSKGADYVRTKVALCLHYCVNLAFFLRLKARHVSVVDHPVVGRIMQYSNLLSQLASADEAYRAEMDQILQRLSQGEEIESQEASLMAPRGTRTGHITAKDKKRKLSQLMIDSSGDEETRESGDYQVASQETAAEQLALKYYEMMKAGKSHTQPTKDEGAVGGESEEEEEEGEEQGEERRGINYQISKNKGLTPRRKKENRNPRVKNRKKYQKAKNRRRGQVKEVHKELRPYGGEMTGVRAGVKKSVKFKS